MIEVDEKQLVYCEVCDKYVPTINGDKSCGHGESMNDFEYPPGKELNFED